MEDIFKAIASIGSIRMQCDLYNAIVKAFWILVVCLVAIWWKKHWMLSHVIAYVSNLPISNLLVVDKLSKFEGKTK